jgi:hypothetical protein
MMNDDFNQRWSTAAKTARQVPDDASEAVPFGFTTRLMARFQESPVEPWVDLMTALGLRAVVTSALLFAASAVLVFWQLDGVPLVSDWIDVPLPLPFTPEVLLP